MYMYYIEVSNIYSGIVYENGNEATLSMMQSFYIASSGVSMFLAVVMS